MTLEFQRSKTDCGPACLQMVASHFGRPVSRAEILRICPPGEKGTSLAQLADAADQLGMRGLVARIALRNLARVNLPCIAYVSYGHYVVIENIGRRHIRIADPIRGRVAEKTSDFMKYWAEGDGDQGTVLLLEPSHELGRSSRGGFADIRFFWRYLRTHRPLLAQVLASIGIGSGLQLPMVFLTRSLVDVGIASRSMRFVYVILASQLAMFVARAANDFLRGWVMLHVTSRTNLAILADFLKRLMRVSTGYMEQKPIGDILQRVGDHSRVQSFLTYT
ncbi:MAG TPA: cysteine peptidase family C39 domain-containing protein, partial [Thermoanaerobaculia bacterium]